MEIGLDTEEDAFGIADLISAFAVIKPTISKH